MAFSIESGMLRTAKGLDLLSVVWAIVATFSMFAVAMTSGFFRDFFIQWMIFAVAIPVGIRAVAWLIRGFFPANTAEKQPREV
ncbi:hypothetical protein [Pollutimonas nitritireducens]|nr:hypothetical protein [Pollutimonas nitritireducens]